MIVEYLNDIKNRIASFNFDDYFVALDQIGKVVDLSAYKPIKIAVLRSYTVEAIEPILRLRLILEGYNPVFFFGDFNQYNQEILNLNSNFYRFKPNLVLLMLRLEDVLPSFFWNFGEQQFWDKEIKDFCEHFLQLIQRLNDNLVAPIIIQNMSLFYPYYGIYDAQIVANQSKYVELINFEFREIASKNPNVFIWDFAQYALHYGLANIYDSKLWYLARSPFKVSAYVSIAYDLMRYILSILGNIKKCIVLDLDNTLWGGVIGEDGINGIALGQDYPGICYVDFQRELLKLYHRGIILAINSKNNEKDVFEVLEKHPHMILRRNHFAAYRINWSDKVSNLQLLANDLNISIDSIIFIDDNQFECELVAKHHPECAVVPVPDKPYLLPLLIQKLPYIENIRLTSEDLRKGSMYYAKVERQKFESTAASLENFLDGLGMQVMIKKADDFSIPRIAQLTQKTNQFNMTTHRYTEADIINFVNSADGVVFSVAARDRFGDHGIIGVVILKLAADDCWMIDTFLLSCRVIGRAIEETMLAFIVDFVRGKKCQKLVGEFIATAKNKPAADFYSKMGLTNVEGGVFLIDINTRNFGYSPYIKLMTDSDF